MLLLQSVDNRAIVAYGVFCDCTFASIICWRFTNSSLVIINAACHDATAGNRFWKEFPEDATSVHGRLYYMTARNREYPTENVLQDKGRSIGLYCVSRTMRHSVVEVR